MAILCIRTLKLLLDLGPEALVQVRYETLTIIFLSNKEPMMANQQSENFKRAIISITELVLHFSVPINCTFATIPNPVLRCNVFCIPLSPLQA